MRTRPRGLGRRAALAALLWLGVGAVALGLPRFVIGDAGTQDLGSGWSLNPAQGVTALLGLTIYGLLATKVSERWYYALWLLVPIAGLLASWTICWRLAYLPSRDWDLRDDEQPGPHDVAYAGHPGSAG